MLQVIRIFLKKRGWRCNLLLGRQIQVFLSQDVGQLGQGGLGRQISTGDQSGVNQHLKGDGQQRSGRCFQAGNILPEGGRQ